MIREFLAGLSEALRTGSRILERHQMTDQTTLRIETSIDQQEYGVLQWHSNQAKYCNIFARAAYSVASEQGRCGSRVDGCLFTRLVVENLIWVLVYSSMTRIHTYEINNVVDSRKDVQWKGVDIHRICFTLRGALGE